MPLERHDCHARPAILIMWIANCEKFAGEAKSPSRPLQWTDTLKSPRGRLAKATADHEGNISGRRTQKSGTTKRPPSPPPPPPSRQLPWGQPSAVQPGMSYMSIAEPRPKKKRQGVSGNGSFSVRRAGEGQSQGPIRQPVPAPRENAGGAKAYEHKLRAGPRSRAAEDYWQRLASNAQTRANVLP